MATIGILGGGIGGLAAAYDLSTTHKVVLFEQSERLGGKIHTHYQQGCALELGPDAVVRYKPQALELMHDLGLAQQVQSTMPASPSAMIYDGQQAYPIPEGLQVVIPSSVQSLMASPLISPLGKLRALYDVLVPAKPIAHDVAFGDLIRSRLGNELWRKLVSPLTGGIYGGKAEELSTMATFPQLLELINQHGSLIKGAGIRRKTTGTREKGQLFASLEGGLQTWINALEGAIRPYADIRLNTTVQSLERNAGGYVVRTATDHTEVDMLLLALPAYQLAPMVQGLHPAAAQALASINYGNSATVSLVFERGQTPPRVGHGLLSAGGTHARGFTWVDQKWANRIPEGLCAVRAYFSGVEGDEATLIALAKQDLNTLWGRCPQEVFSKVQHFKQGLPKYTLGHMQRAEQALELEQLPNVFVVGPAYGGVGIPEVVRMARSVAQRIG